MPSRERRLLDKNIEIRKLQSELKHYKTQFFVAVVEKDKMQKALDYATTMLERIAVSPETMLEPEKIIPQLAAQALERIKNGE